MESKKTQKHIQYCNVNLQKEKEDQNKDGYRKWNRT